MTVWNICGVLAMCPVNVSPSLATVSVAMLIEHKSDGRFFSSADGSIA